MLKFIHLIILSFSLTSLVAQNAIVGDFSTGWGGGGCPTGATDFSLFAASVGTSYIGTRTVASTGDKYWRFGVDWGGTTGQYTITIGSDVVVTPSTAYALTMSCTVSGSLKYNVPNTSYNYVFKTLDAGASPTGSIVFFEVQGAVQTISSVSQSPTSGNVFPGQAVVVTATTSGTSTGQNYYLRYTSNAWATSTVITMAGAGTSYAATIPTSTNTASTSIAYCVFSSGPSNVAADGSNADLFTINLNNNSGSNYSYTVANGWTTAATGDWSIAGTWTANAVPSTTESMGAVSILHDVTMDQNANVSSISITSPKILTINNGSTLTTTGASSIDGIIKNAGTMAVSGGSWAFSATGKYQHNYETTAGTIPTATWNSGSTCEIIGYTSNTSSPGELGQTFSNFTWNCTNQAANIQLAGNLSVGNSTAILGNFTISSTGSTGKWMHLSTSQDITLSIGGNFSISGGELRFASTTGNVTLTIAGDYSQTGGIVDVKNGGTAGTYFINVAGNFSITSGTIKKTLGAATAKIVFNKASGIQTFSSASGGIDTHVISVDVGTGGTTNTLQLNSALAMNTGATATLTVYSGSVLDLGTYTVTGNTFAVNSGGTIKIGSTDGITSAGATGNVQTTTRTFDGGANYVYSGSANQGTGNGLPTTINTLTIENSGGGGNNTVTLTTGGTLTISGTSNSLVLTSGLFSVGSANIISIPSGGTVTSGGGDFASGSAAGTVTFAGTGTVSGTVNFYHVNISDGVNFGAGSTINGTLSINTGGYVNTNAPTYGSSSTLKYNTGAAFTASTEWGTGASGQGVPFNVRTSTNGTALSFTGGSARTAQGNVTIDVNTSFTLSATSGGDLILQGNWTNNGTFDPNTRSVTLSGSSLQTINSATTFDYLIMSNLSGGGVNLGASIVVDNNLNFTQGVINLSSNNLTITSGGTITGYTSARFINTSGSGSLIMTVSSSDITFPVGPAVSIYCPVTLNNPNTTDDFSINTSITVTNPTYNDTRRVNLQWKIVEAVPGGSASTVKLQWPSSRHAASFNPAGAVQIGVWNGSSYDANASTVSASYLATSTATISTFDAAKPFVVANDDAFAPYYYTAQDGDWNTTSTWTCSCIPASNANIGINHAVTVNSAVANPATSVTINASKSITFGASGTLTTTTLTNDGSLIMSSGGVLTIATAGTFANNSVFTSGSGKVAFAGSATVSGTNSFYNVDISGAVDFGGSSTITNMLSILAGGSVNTNAPTYAANSTLNYAADYELASEWYTSSSSGQGVPYNVTINGGNVYMNAGAAVPRYLTGSLTIGPGKNFSLSAAAGGDLYIQGNISSDGTFSTNGRAVFFNGAGNQTITKVGGGEISFDYININKSSGNLLLSASPATNIKTNATSGDVLTLTNGTIDLNGQKLTIDGQGGNIRINSSAKTITGSAGSTMHITGTATLTNKTVTSDGSGSLIIDDNVVLKVESGCVDFGNGLTTVNGTLEILNQGCATTNATVFGSNSYLVYNTGGVFERKIEWNDASLQNVTVKSGCTVDMDDTPAQSRSMAGNLLVENGGTMSMFSRSSSITVNGNVNINSTGVIDMDDMTSTLIIIGNIVIDGTLDMSTQVGGDIELKGNWTRTGTFTHQNRMVTFNSTANQYIYSTTTFGYLKINNSAGAEVLLAVDINIDNTCSGTVESGAILNLGTYTVSGAGTFENKANGTIKIGSLVGITSAGATGNVQSATRTFNGAGIYHYIGAANQVSGNGLPTPMLSGGRVICETNSLSTTFAASNTIRFNAGATFEIRQGTVNDNGSNFFAATGDAANTGDLTMSGGLYVFNDNLSLGSALRYPRLSGTYTLSGGVIELAATLASAQYQHLRGGRTYYNVKISGGSVSDGFKRISSAISITNNLEITGATTIFDIESNGMDGDAGLTMDNGRLRMSKVSTSLPELAGMNTVYNITGGTIEFYGTNSTQQQLIRGSYGSGPSRISYYNLELNSSAANVSTPVNAGNVDLSESFEIQNEVLVNSPTVLRMDASDYIEGVGDFTLTTGSSLFYGSANGIKTSGTGVSDGNIRITGTRTFLTDASYGFVGAGSMVTGNALPATVVDLYVYRTNNTSITSLSQAVVATGDLEFGGGKIQLGIYDLTITGDINGEDADMYVITNSDFDDVSKGFLIRNVAAVEKEFPLGTANGSYTPCFITNAGTARDFSVRVFPGVYEHGISGNLMEDPIANFTDRTWEITPDNEAGVDATIKLQWNSAEHGTSFSTATGKMIKNLGGVSDDWVELASGAVAGSNPYTSTVSGITDFSKFAIKDDDIDLPVELLFFEAQNSGQAISLFWATASETNNDYFTIERSIDAKHFEYLTTLKGAGNSDRILNYSETDFYPYKGISYYRLKQTDFDGNYSYSDIRIVKSGCNNLSLFATDYDGKVSVIITNPEEDNFTFAITDVTGRLIYKETIKSKDQHVMLDVESGMLSSGVYNIFVYNNSETKTIRFVAK